MDYVTRTEIYMLEKDLEKLQKENQEFKQRIEQLEKIVNEKILAI